MSHYTRHYAGLSPQEADDRALRDIEEYLSSDQWTLLTMAAADPTSATFHELKFALGMVGVRDYPVHAFLRKYRLAEYRAWMASDPDPIQTDEEGFRLTETDGSPDTLAVPGALASADQEEAR